MALIKSIELPSGVTANYVKILRFGIANDFEHNRKQFLIDYAIFKNKESRDANKKSVTDGTVVTAVDFSYSNTDARPALYAILKTLPEFSGATDDV